MGGWQPALTVHADDRVPDPLRKRRLYRHQIPTLAYLNLNQSNGGIIRNLGQAGIAVQTVAPLSVGQEVFLRFNLANPRVHVQGTGRVAWADPAGRAGIEFIAFSRRTTRGLKDWIFVQLLTMAQATADSNFVYLDDATALQFSLTARPAIPFSSIVRNASRTAAKSPRSLRLSWFPWDISPQSLSRLVDTLIVSSAVLLFAVICIAIVGSLPAWPITLILGCVASGAFAVIYRLLFLFWMGATPGANLAGLTSNDLDSIKQEKDDTPRFR